MQKTVVVLTGPMAAGKEGLEGWAGERRIPFFSMSEMVEEHAGRSKEELGRRGMQDFANEQRAAHGADVYAREIAKRIDSSDSGLVVVDGMRNVHEGEYFRAHYETIIVGIVPSSPEQEFSNMQDRGRPGDPQTKEQFDQLRQRELGVGEGEEGQQVEPCLEMADLVITKEGGEEGTTELVRRFEQILTERGVDFQELGTA